MARTLTKCNITDLGTKKDFDQIKMELGFNTNTSVLRHLVRIYFSYKKLKNENRALKLRLELLK